jgi:hypothetical protein
MLARCNNPNHGRFSVYGGAGVKVCPEWLTFDGFLKSMGERPAGTTLSRLGDTGDYKPGNVIWGNHSHQVRQRRLRKVGTNGGRYEA